MAKAELQAESFFSDRKDEDLAFLLRAQPAAAAAAHITLDKLAQAGLPKAYTAVLHAALTSQQNEPSPDNSAAHALHQLISSMTEKTSPFVIEVIAAMHAAGVSLNSANADADTPLHLAARSGHLLLCQILLQNGADPLTRNSKNRLQQFAHLRGPLCGLWGVRKCRSSRCHAGRLGDRQSLLQR